MIVKIIIIIIIIIIKKSMGSFDNKITRILKANTSENFSKPKHTKKVYKG